MIRLKKMAYYQTLNNVSYENEDLYKEIDTSISNINISINAICYEDNLDNISGELYNIISYAREIQISASSAKSNGVTNENYLSQGKDILEDLQKELADLQTVFDDLDNQCYELKSRLAKKIKGLIKKSNHGFICNAHDSIYESSDKIESLANDVLTNLPDELEGFDINGYMNPITYECDIIESDLSEARDMNERMGNGIDKKNSNIEGLQSDIDELTHSIKEKENEISDLESEID